MKQLQNNFTTPEQSKRLLELGLPAWTANIMFDINRRRYDLIDPEDESWAETERTLFYNGGAIPHWSVGRLIEIYFICSFQPEILIDYTMEDLVDYLVSLFESVAMDFSKLEN